MKTHTIIFRPQFCHPGLDLGDDNNWKNPSEDTDRFPELSVCRNRDLSRGGVINYSDQQVGIDAVMAQTRYDHEHRGDVCLYFYRLVRIETEQEITTIIQVTIR